MPRTETTPDPALDTEAPEHPGTGDAPSVDELTDDPAGVARLLKDLAEDTRTLVQQEIELIRLEVGHSLKRITTDGAWIWAGAVVVTVGLICLALALALGLGALLDSYWLGTLITGGAFLLLGGLVAWRGIRDLKSGGLLPTNPLESLEENRDWAQGELDELKQAITEER
ncbi:MAG: phage holin family protein [Candidatus Longimicrobiales bacterium M2_2A_002]